MDTLCFSACNKLNTLPEKLVGLSALRVYEIKKDIFLQFCEDAISIYIQDVLNAFLTEASAKNAVGKCSNLGLTSGSFKEAGKKTPHVAVNPFEMLVEEKTELYSYGPPEIIVLSSRPLAEPSMFDFCGLLSGSTIPSSSNSPNLWIVDSGATHHACFSAASFECGYPISNSVVSLPNGDSVPVLGTGSVRLCNDLTLQNVLFIPQFHCNLLSISALTQQHPYVVSFHSDGYVIEDPTHGRRIGMGRKVGNLYILDLSNMFFISP